MDKEAIKSALASISTGDFLEKSKDLLATIGYRSELTLELSGTVHDFFLRNFHRSTQIPKPNRNKVI